MNCQECEKLIDDYINNSLDETLLDDFIKHIDSCQSCKEELTVNYSLITALKQLDSGEDLSSDYEFEIDQKIQGYKLKQKTILRRKVYGYVFTFLIGFIVALIIMIFRNDEALEYSTDKNATKILFEYDGVPDAYDAVNDTINKYNAQLIDYIHSTK